MCNKTIIQIILKINNQIFKIVNKMYNIFKQIINNEDEDH
jgi:hypothetical protein